LKNKRKRKERKNFCNFEKKGIVKKRLWEFHFQSKGALHKMNTTLGCGIFFFLKRVLSVSKE